MKKNLRNILTLSLGLMTTVAFGQDWDVDSRTRIDMSGDNNMMQTDQRATIGATWGGSDWGIHVSTDVNYRLGTANTAEVPVNVYEAYASTNVMGYANVTVGRQALNYGSGAILSSNDWAANRTTWDGFTIDLGVEMADITIGYASQNNGMADLDETNSSNMFANVAKAEGDWSVNLLVTSASAEAGGVEVGNRSAMGLDLTYALMGGDLGLAATYNTATAETGGVAAEDMDMMGLSATYNINDDFSATLGQTTYGEGGFSQAGTNMSGGYAGSGQLGYLNADDQNMHVGINYGMGDFSMGLTMNMITNNGDGAAAEDYERNVNEFSLGYAMSDNANLSLSYASDAVNDLDAVKWMWLTLNVTP